MLRPEHPPRAARLNVLYQILVAEIVEEISPDAENPRRLFGRHHGGAFDLELSDDDMS